MPAKTTGPRGNDGKFAAVLREYETSPNFTKNELSTQENYRRVLGWADAVLGHLSVHEIRPALVQAALDGLADRPGAQVMARAVLSAVDKWAVLRERLPRSITFGTEVIGLEGGHAPWTDPQVKIGELHAKAGLSRVVTLAVHLGQRGSDVVRMRLSDMEDQQHPITGRMYPGIHVVQQKTGLRLWVPFTDELAEHIKVWRREIGPPWLFVTKQDGSPYTRPQLSWQWNHQRDTEPALEPLKTAGLVLHGLRGTAVVRLRKAGASVLQICSMIGMSEPMVTRYSRFADRTDMSLAAVHHLNTGTIPERKLSEKTKN
jgi:integrase